MFCPLPEGDPKNYLTYYKRAAVFLAMGKSKSALPDLSRAILLKPDFLAVSPASLGWLSQADLSVCLPLFPALPNTLSLLSLLSLLFPTGLSLVSRPVCREGTSC